MAAIKPPRKNISASNIEKIQEEIKVSDKIDISINIILSPKFHDRRFINKHSIVELSESIKLNGLIYPIVLRMLDNGKYERIIGYRRIEAYKILKRTTIPAIVLKNISDEEALLLMTTENIQREDLSIYDETLALLDYIGVSLQIGTDEVLKLLNRYKNFSSGVINLTQIEKDNYEKVESILAKTGKITINTLVNRLSMLNVHPLLKQKLSEGSLSFSNAQILNKISDDALLSSSIDKVISESYSKRETYSFVKSLLPTKKTHSDNIDKISKIKLEQLSKSTKNKVNKLIEEILVLVKQKPE